jgi:hypothetical protein
MYNNTDGTLTGVDLVSILIIALKRYEIHITGLV